METLINKKVVYNPISKVIMTTSVIPVCDYWSNPDEAPVEQRNAMVDTYGNEILANHGELSIADNGDIFVTRQSEELYTELPEEQQTTKDYYFINMNISEQELMSGYEFENHKMRTVYGVLRRYMTAEEKNLIYTDYNAYLKKLQDIQDNTATVVVTVEATMLSWLETAFGKALKSLNSKLIKKVFGLIKLKQLSVSSWTDLRTQMFGVAKNFYPFVYFKETGIYDMCTTISHAPKKLSEIDITPYDPNQMNIYWKEISSNKKNLMTICKWTNTDTWAIPEGQFKSYIYDSPVNKKIIGDLDSVLEGLNVEILRHGSYTEYNVSIDNAIATNKLDDIYRKYLYDKYGMIQVVGTKQQKDTTSQSIYLNDYGFTLPLSRLSVQHQKIFRFEEAEKFVVYYCFYKQKSQDGQSWATESDYFSPDGNPTKALAYMATTKIQSKQNWEKGNDMNNWPLVDKQDFSSDIRELTKEVWHRQDFAYDETYINDFYNKGYYYYMTKTSQSQSVGFIGITCKVRVKVPTSACLGSDMKPIQTTSTKTFELRTVVSVSDMNDAYQIKDTISAARFDMLSKMYGLLDMWLKKDLEITGTPTDQIDNRVKTLLFYGAMHQCLIDVDYYTKKVLLRDVIPKKEQTLFEVFPKTFNIFDEKIEYLTDFKDIAESSYVYELRTFNGARSMNQSYTVSNQIRYVPTPMPFNIHDMKKNYVVINFNALVPSVASDYEMGGGFIGKKNYKMIEDVFIKYIVSKSKEFRSGLSNSEIVRFEIDTIETRGLDKLYDDVFPTIRKDIGLTFKRMTDSVEDEEWESIFLSNNLITNLIYDHNYLSQSDVIRMQLAVYDKDE